MSLLEQIHAAVPDAAEERAERQAHADAKAADEAVRAVAARTGMKRSRISAVGRVTWAAPPFSTDRRHRSLHGWELTVDDAPVLLQANQQLLRLPANCDDCGAYTAGGLIHVPRGGGSDAFVTAYARALAGKAPVQCATCARGVPHVCPTCGHDRTHD